MRRLAAAVMLGLVVLVFSASARPHDRAAGTPDPTFAGDGAATFRFGEKTSSSEANAVGVQPDGAIVVVGGSGGKFAVARLTAQGALDPAFADRGRRLIGFGLFELPHEEGYPTGAVGGANGADVAIQEDGKLVVAGSASQGKTRGDMALTRLLPNGSLDRTFGDRGRITLDFGRSRNEEAQALAIQPDGKIVVAGSQEGSSFAVARVTPGGRADPSFSGDGRRIFRFGVGSDTNDFAYGVAVQADGKIVVSGQSWPRQENSNTLALARLKANGSLDRHFGDKGRRLIPFGFHPERPERHDDWIGALALQPDGGMVIVGQSSPHGLSNPGTFSVARVTSSGDLDPSFSDDGRQIVSFDSASSAAANEVAVDAQGRIVVVGDTDVASINPAFAVARLLPNGELDPAFSEDGRAVTDINDFWDEAEAVALQPDGKIVAAGFASRTLAGKRDVAIVRYDP